MSGDHDEERDADGSDVSADGSDADGSDVSADGSDADDGSNGHDGGVTADGVEEPTERNDSDRDLYEVATWEPRSFLDRFSVGLYHGLSLLWRVVVVVLALAILLALVALGALGALLQHPAIGVLVLLSALPALALAAYVWYADATTSEPLWTLVVTFVLGVLFAGFAAVLNTLTQPLFGLVPVVGTVLFFYVVVGPVEETVKWLAVRIYAYRNASFDAVIDGAVYGAVAGLGFATIENALYIGRSLQGPDAANLLLAAGGTAAVRALAGPGHVIYSAFAGYYLGLAKFNPDDYGPIVVKGLLIAAFIHATYDSLSSIIPSLITANVSGAPYAVGVLAFIVAYDGLFGYLLYRKLRHYRDVYLDTAGGGGDGDGASPN